MELQVDLDLLGNVAIGEEIQGLYQEIEEILNDREMMAEVDLVAAEDEELLKSESPIDNSDSLWAGSPVLENILTQEKWIEVEDDIYLRILIFSPKDSKYGNSNPVVMIPGWGSLFEGWKPLISKWATKRKIFYIETREKKSSRINRKSRKSDFIMSRHGQDIRTIIQKIDLQMDEIEWFASSLGSTILIDSFQKGILSGKSAILLAPNSDFMFPLWFRIGINLPIPVFIFKRLVNFISWKVQKRTKEPAQKERYRRNFTALDVEKMLLSARSNIGFALPEDLSEIKVRCAVMTAYSDTLHDFDKIRFIKDSIPNCELIEVPSNQYAHEAEVLNEIEEFQSK